MTGDLFFIIKWWFFIFIIGLIFFPFVSAFFRDFFDRGYIFSKTVGIAFLSYAIFLLGTLRILPFDRSSIFLILIFFLITSIVLFKRKFSITKKQLIIIGFQEIFFLSSLLFWSYIKSFQPDIHGLEKYMDFGFINSVLRSTYFPSVDMWYPPLSINYYYFGHLTTAVLIKFTNIPGSVSYNLMLSTIFAFTLTSSFSIVSTITQNVLKKAKTSLLAGILSGLLVGLGGNLHAIYSFFETYNPPENPVPFWQLKFLPESFPNNYWYPNATRFIPLTIHEFPSYSFVVSDLHGHVLDIPYVLVVIGLILSLFLRKKISFGIASLIALMLAILYMTNAWDGAIYFFLFSLSVILIKSDILKIRKHKKTDKNPKRIKVIKSISNKIFPGSKSAVLLERRILFLLGLLFTFLKERMFFEVLNKKNYFLKVIILIIFVGTLFFLFSLPFNSYFKPFVSGIGVVCAPEFLIAKASLGPFIFEADHCHRTPFWMLIILYGFFYFFAVSLILKVLRLKTTPVGVIYVLLLILVSTILIATPEFIYAKDIYPAHYRANTMFKLGYQAFIMLSLVTGFSIAYIFHNGRKLIWLPITFVLISLIFLYPYFAVMSYFGNLSNFRGLDGLSYLKTLYPGDYDAILWIQNNITGQPVIAESQGDSYTDHGRVSANTGLPTILGWTVHEWLWRGNYSFPQARLEDAKLIYEGTYEQILQIIKKHNVSYIYIGQLEKTKHTTIDESKFQKIGKLIYKNPTVSIYKVD